MATAFFSTAGVCTDVHACVHTHTHTHAHTFCHHEGHPKIQQPPLLNALTHVNHVYQFTSHQPDTQD